MPIATARRIKQMSPRCSRASAQCIGDANYAVQYDVNRDGDIDVQDVSLVGSCVVAYGDVRVLYLPLIRK